MKTQIEDTLTHARRDLKTMASFAATTPPTEVAPANAANGHQIVYPESDGKPSKNEVIGSSPIVGSPKFVWLHAPRWRAESAVAKSRPKGRLHIE